jgi:4-aminobutyrate aminotransferase-like enzyme/Ser/Thr protein kinase RdoA (MazF antagonist)
MSDSPTTAWRNPAPVVSIATAERVAVEVFGMVATAKPLDSYIDCNFLLTDHDGRRAVLKICNEAESRGELELQQAMLACLAEKCAAVAPQQIGEITAVVGDDGRVHLARLASYLPGELLADHHHAATSATWRELGELLARIDQALAGLSHPHEGRFLRWNLSSSSALVNHGAQAWNSEQRNLTLAASRTFTAHVSRRLNDLPWQLIHNDANEFNLLVESSSKPPKIVGIFDFGDVVKAPRIFELAVAGAYVAIGGERISVHDSLARVAEMVAGYESRFALSDSELEALFPAMLMRLALSLSISSADAEHSVDNHYITVNQEPAWWGLREFQKFTPAQALHIFRQRLGRPSDSTSILPKTEILDKRLRHTGKSLSISYTEPLTIIQGRGSWLYDEQDHGYLDGVNNVCHVGHCHPKVVAAAQQQIAALNTNTRYLHPNLAQYAERLADLFPDPLSVCFFVNSGSEANELALRMARAATGRRNVLTMEGGYHGNTGALIDLSHYKHAGPGGSGPPPWVRTVACPDIFRGLYRVHADVLSPLQAAEKYAALVAKAADDFQPAAFMFEPLIGCGGQIVPPAGYWTAACQYARDAGAIIIADEVQVGFGRVGRHWWAHQLDDKAGGAKPDIVTVGKPIGNGHPMAAVITTPTIADAFANGMEYFNTFGGNPVSCAIGMAVLDVIEEEELLQNAAQIGERLKHGLFALAEKFPVIGDVRGAGLYLGAEFVDSARQPNAARLTAVLDHCKTSGLLFSSDGPDHNVLKIKPPMVWTATEAEFALAVLKQGLSETE